MFGFDVGYTGLPFSLSLQRDYSFFFAHNDLSPTFTDKYAIDLIWQEDQIHLYWKRKYWTLGLGHYWKRYENAAFYVFIDDYPLQRGVQTSISTSIGALDVELRYKLGYAPIFAVRGADRWSLLLIHRFQRRENRLPPTTKWQKALQMNFLLGGRFFPTVGWTSFPGESLSKVGFAPLLGVEVLWEKYRTSFNMEKDWWIAMNAGSFRRNFKGYVTQTFIGFRHHWQLPNERHLRAGLGVTFIEDIQVYEAFIKLPPSQRDLHLYNYHVKGVGFSASYELAPNCDLELKGLVATKGEKAFSEPRRFSLGLTYRISPKTAAGQ